MQTMDASSTRIFLAPICMYCHCLNRIFHKIMHYELFHFGFYALKEHVLKILWNNFIIIEIGRVSAASSHLQEVFYVSTFDLKALCCPL